MPGIHHRETRTAVEWIGLWLRARLETAVETIAWARTSISCVSELCQSPTGTCRTDTGAVDEVISREL